MIPAKSNRIIIPFDDFYDQFNTEIPARLKGLMDAHEFGSCIQAINKTITHKLLASRKLQRARNGILIILGLCFVAAPLIVLMSGKGTAAAYIVPPAIFFVLIVIVAVYSYKNSMDLSKLAASSIEPVLRDLNKKHLQQGLTWRLHKKNSMSEDFGFDDDPSPTVEQGHTYSYWIEIEILETDFNLLHEQHTPTEKRPLRPPAPPKSPLMPTSPLFSSSNSITPASPNLSSPFPPSPSTSRASLASNASSSSLPRSPLPPTPTLSPTPAPSNLIQTEDLLGDDDDDFNPRGRLL